MNEYTYQKIQVGIKAEFTQKISAEMLESFKTMSGDINPLHTDSQFAKKNKFADKVAYGMLVGSFYSTLVGVYLPGRNCLLQSINIDFVKPVYVGDELKIYGEVVEKNDSVERVIVKAYIKNQYGDKVSRAKIETGVLREDV